MSEDERPKAGGAKPRRAVAVAIAGGEAPDAVPRVTATGRGALAEQLLAIAFAHGVPVRTDADLAEIVAAMEVESEIPVAAFAAVAEILSYVYRLNRAREGAAATVGEGPAGS